MGPLLSGSGNSHISVVIIWVDLDFNGAASQWKRKFFLIISSTSGSFGLQWGRFSVEAEIYTFQVASKLYPRTSMGPLLSGSGNRRAEDGLFRFGTVLQWGRFSVDAELSFIRRGSASVLETSMGPLLSGSGNISTEKLYLMMWYRLQWGRFSVEAEIFFKKNNKKGGGNTSMGPLLSGSGNEGK